MAAWLLAKLYRTSPTVPAVDVAGGVSIELVLRDMSEGRPRSRISSEYSNIRRPETILVVFPGAQGQRTPGRNRPIVWPEEPAGAMT